MGTTTIARIFGIPIRVTGAFLWIAGVLAVLSLLGRDGGFGGIVLLGLLLVSLVLHELGHALVARSLGVRVVDITLWHLGGMARMTEIPESPRIEAQIAIAGPAVNLALAALAAPLLLLGEGLGAAGVQLVTVFVEMNLLLGLLNLLPGFPMDGGRILRAFLATRTDFLGATERAVRVGKWTAGAMLVAGMFFSPAGFVLALLVAGFVWIAGTRELITVRVRHTGSPFGAAFAQRAFRFGGAFDPGGGSAGPATGDPREADAQVDGPDAGGGSDGRAGTGGAQRPTDAPSAGSAPGRGFTDEDVRRLEAWRGSLRRRGGE